MCVDDCFDSLASSPLVLFYASFNHNDSKMDNLRFKSAILWDVIMKENQNMDDIMMLSKAFWRFT
jgi:hypothetical protein